MTDETRIRQSFLAQSMMTTLGAKLVDIGPGRVTIVAPILPGSRQQHGHGHAALAFAIGDSAAGYAALSVLPDGQEVLTAEMKINLLAPAQGDRLVAVGRVEKAGRRLIVVSAEVFAETQGDRHRVALMQGTMVPVET
jgi:uncharacterized protein (TIGR00369 family)